MEHPNIHVHSLDYYGFFIQTIVVMGAAQPFGMYVIDQNTQWLTPECRGD